jgi:methionyl-tRNA synthetase
MLRKSARQIFADSLNKLNSMISNLDKQLGTCSVKNFTEQIEEETKVVQPVSVPMKPKVEKEGKKSKMAETKVNPDIALFEECDLRVGKVTSLSYLENSDDIYYLKVDLGEGQLREIGTGLRKYVPEDQILNKGVIVFSNLKPKKLLSTMT